MNDDGRISSVETAIRFISKSLDNTNNELSTIKDLCSEIDKKIVELDVSFKSETTTIKQEIINHKVEHIDEERRIEKSFNRRTTLIGLIFSAVIVAATLFSIFYKSNKATYASNTYNENYKRIEKR